MKSFHIVLALLLPVVLIACDRQPVAEPDSGAETAISDSDSLIEALRAAGATVEPAGVLEEPVFQTEAQMITVNGESVQVFEFESEEAAKAAAGTVSQAGTLIGETIVEWRDAPHFYRAGRVIVIYAGNNEATLNTLQAVLGEPFATGVGMFPSETPDA